MSTLVSDLRYGARMLWKDRRFTLVALVALTLGIGATTAIYTVVDAVLLRPLPFPRAGELVDIQSVGRSGAGVSSYPDFVDFRARSRTLADAAAYTGTQAVLTGHDNPTNLDALSVTPSF